MNESNRAEILALIAEAFQEVAQRLDLLSRMPQHDDVAPELHPPKAGCPYKAAGLKNHTEVHAAVKRMWYFGQRLDGDYPVIAALTEVLAQYNGRRIPENAHQPFLAKKQALDQLGAFAAKLYVKDEGSWPKSNILMLLMLAVPLNTLDELMEKTAYLEAATRTGVPAAEGIETALRLLRVGEDALRASVAYWTES